MKVTIQHLKEYDVFLVEWDIPFFSKSLKRDKICIGTHIEQRLCHDVAWL
jgi:hypothetical protein